MKLSMWIFADWLAEFHPQTDIKQNQFDIEAVRLFASDLTMDKHTMYIGRLRDLFKNGNDNIICVHNNDMLLLNTTELEEVLNCVLNALAYYTGWDNTMMNQLTSGAMLQDLMDASADVLKSPVFILDSGQRHLAHNQNYKSGQVDELWDFLLDDGTCDMDFLIRFNQFDPKRLSRKGLYTYQQPVFPNAAWHYNFLQGSNFLGSATYIDLDRSATRGRLDCFLLFCQYVDRWFQLHIREQESLILDEQIRTVICDPRADSRELCRRLVLYGWHENDSLVFLKLDAPYQPFNINTHLCHTLNANFTNIYAVITELSICILCNVTVCSLEETVRNLKPWLKSSKYYATMGQIFTMDDSFFKQYQFVEKTSGFTGKEIGTVYNGAQYAFPYLLSEMQHTAASETLHPALKMLEEYDASHHTDFYHTLYVYLSHERSIADTARVLNLHRNSLLYRLKRLHELLDADLENPLVRLHILLSYEIKNAS